MNKYGIRYITGYYSQLPARELESSIIHAADAEREPHTKKTGNLVVNSLVIGGHSSLLERLSKRRVSVTCSCNIL